ncbi:MAG: RpoL/Rpb11 RNA polymerase subunit family protein [Nanoarchaeota archaeon]
MEVEIVSQSANELELKIDNLTVAEILRVYLNEQGIKFAAWRREHPTKPIVFRIESSGKTVKKAVSEAVAAISKDLNVLAKGLVK